MSFRTTVTITLILFAASVATAGVALMDLGPWVRLDNGIVSATWTKNNGNMISLKLNNVELMGNAGKGYLNVGINGDVRSVDTHCTYSLIQDTDLLKEISFKRTHDAAWPMDIDQRFVIQDGVCGIYCYQVYSHNGSMPDADLTQSRMAFRISPDIFKRVYLDDGRVYDEPLPSAFAAGTPLVPQEARRLADGSVYYKYLRSNYLKDAGVYGWAGSGKGAWVVRPSLEYHNGGPTKQHICAHQTETTPVILTHMVSGHYGSGSANVKSGDGDWVKVAGPVFLYLNENADPDAAWANAKEQLEMEKNYWPYSWMKHPHYPLAASRGTVTGRLHITDGSSPAGALIILAQPTNGTVDTNWQRQGKDYIFWTETAADGSFTIEKVRPGEYTLYANVPGVLDEYELDAVTVTPGIRNTLGQLNWIPRTHGQLIWQIGTPDRTAAEYLHGDDFRHFGLWFDYAKDFPDGVTYTIGRSNEAIDWNFNQWCVENSNGGYDPSPWTIEFDIDKIVGDQAVLTIAIAAARNARLRVLVNKVEVLGDDALVNDSAGPRAGIRGFYRERIIMFDSSILSTRRTNRIVLEQRRAGLFQSIMYDCIRLETGFKAHKGRFLFRAPIKMNLHSRGLFCLSTASGCIDLPRKACFAFLARVKTAHARCDAHFDSDS